MTIMKTTTTYRKKDNGWQVIVSYKQGRTWKQKSKQGFATKSEAKEYEQELIAQIKKAPRPIDKALKNITLEKFCEEYLNARKGLIKGSKQHYTNAVNALQGVSKMPIDRISFRDIQNAVSEWNLAPATQKNYKTYLKALFNAAIKPYRLISENPMNDIEIAKPREKQERRTVTDEEYVKILDVLKSDSVGTLAINVLYYTGLRRGELLALTWDKINWKDSTLTIDAQLNRTVTGRNNLQPPKSKNGYRVIPIPAKLLAILRKHYKEYPLQLDRRLFPLPSVVGRRICTAMRMVDKELSPHCLRHTYATRLLSQGVDVRTVAALIGDDTNTVIRTYIHYTDEMRQAAKNDIEKIFA